MDREDFDLEVTRHHSHSHQSPGRGGNKAGMGNFPQTEGEVSADEFPLRVSPTFGWDKDLHYVSIITQMTSIFF